MTHKELLEQIDRVTREEEMKKQSLESGFSEFKKQMMPAALGWALVAIGLLTVSGMEPAAAVERVSAARGCVVPETPEQRRWITDFAKSLVTGIPK